MIHTKDERRNAGGYGALGELLGLTAKTLADENNGREGKHGALSCGVARRWR